MEIRDNKQHMYNLCKEHIHSYVLAETVDGTEIDGIITGLDNENVYFALPIDNDQQAGNEDRQYHGGYGHGSNYGYGHGPNYGYGSGYGQGYPRRRFNRFVLPLAALAAISILPWY